MQKIGFTFDFLSPYSYLAWTWVRNQSHDFEFNPVPMAGLITHYETKGPAEIEPKRNYLFKDLLRKTHLQNIPFTTPKELPFNSLYALRLSLKGVAGVHQKAVIDAIYTAGWGKGLDIGNDDVLRNVLKDNNLPVDELFAKMEDRSARAELKQNLAAAIERGLFGVPSFTVDNELFWGHDSIPFLEMYLKKEDPLNIERYKSFLNQFVAR